jgi:hypothetical protein
VAGGKMRHKDFGEQSVMSRSSRVHPRDRPKHQRRTSQPFMVRLDTLDLPIAEQFAQMKPYGIGA